MTNINPAALAALAAGSMDNFMAAALPGGIERQEAEGQKSLQDENRLPNDMTPQDRDALCREGFVFKKPLDSTFDAVEFPKGWTIVPDKKHSMYSDLMDPNGNIRGSIFFKAAFYDYKAHLTLHRRYNRRHSYTGNHVHVYVLDYKTDQNVKDFGLVLYDNDHETFIEAESWLAENFPDHEDPNAYWKD